MFRFWFPKEEIHLHSSHPAVIVSQRAIKEKPTILMQSGKTLKDVSKFAQISNRHLQSDPSFPYKDFTRSKLPTTRQARKNTFLFHQKKPTKRQKFYITRRSRYMHIYCKYISNLTKGWGTRNFQPQRERCSKRHQKATFVANPYKMANISGKKNTRIFASNLQVFFFAEW